MLEETEFGVYPGTGPRHIEFHPHKRYVYMINELSNTIKVFKSVKSHPYWGLPSTVFARELQNISTLPEKY